MNALQAVYALPSLLTTWACVTITGKLLLIVQLTAVVRSQMPYSYTGSRLWRMLCITVLSGVILFACQVVYAAVEGGRFENNIVTSEEGRCGYTGCVLYTVHVTHRSLNGPLRFPSVNCNVKGAIIRVLCMFTLSVISHNN